MNNEEGKSGIRNYCML